MKHKRYLVFSYPDYYPSGGLSDVFDSYDTEGEAVLVAQHLTNDYIVVYDRIEGVIIFEKNQ